MRQKTFVGVVLLAVVLLFFSTAVQGEKTRKLI